ncbi:MAG: glycoside hydrolase family 3 protein [Bacteroidales bacterium]|nr:glycoside hydrolase family 3 protein [Bacteroidales bacterium]
MASTWDREMLFTIGKAMGEEFWSFGKHQQLGPCIDLCLDPRAGRSAESGGEDPYLSGQTGASVIKGIQTTPVIATVKHFMVESKQSYRHNCNQIYTDRWMMEHFGTNFRTSVQEGASMSIMSSYNLLNGVHGCRKSSFASNNTQRALGISLLCSFRLGCSS